MSLRVRRSSPKRCFYPQKNPEYFEIRWDLVDCILGCDFCGDHFFKSKKTNERTMELSPNQVFHDTLKNIKKPFKSFVNFAGGEPALYWKKLLQVFENFAENEILVNVPILIKTNGISIGMGTTKLHELKNYPFNELKILFELSIKGTNAKEFELLTRTSKELYRYQLMAYKMLKNVQSHNPNFSFITVLGFYHSSVKGKRSEYAFVYPSDQTLMYEGYRPRDKEFERIWNETERKWVEPLRSYSKRFLENVLQRCGPEGAGLVKHFPQGVITNSESFFPLKPKRYDYARGIINNSYW